MYKKVSIKSISPPFLLGILKYLWGSKSVGWFGNYTSWANAKDKCLGYDSEIILKKVEFATLAVSKGEAIYERDSVIFDKFEYSFQLWYGLLSISSTNQVKLLNVIDFGGALGTTYFQNKALLSSITNLKWNIVEQKKFVDTGKKIFENDRLKFFYSIDDCLNYYEKKDCPQVIILSSVLQYLENPYEFLEHLFSKNFEYIILDRTAFLDKGSDRITIQKVPPEIYHASYPAWFFNENKIINFFKTKYDLIFDFNSYVKGEELYYINNKQAGYGKGFFFKLRHSE